MSSSCTTEAQLHEEMKRLAFLVEEKNQKLRLLQQEQIKLQHQIIAYRDQWESAQKKWKQMQWKKEAKKADAKHQKRNQLLEAVQKRMKSDNK